MKTEIMKANLVTKEAALEPLTKEELNLHTGITDNNACVYVGTYHKYNCGSLDGAWVDLESFHNEKELMMFLYRLHADEAEPEFMVQDYMNFPRRFYSESMNEHDFAELYDWIHLGTEEREMCAEYWKEIDESASIDEIADRLVWSGDWSGGIDEYFDGLADEALSDYNVPNFLQCCFDYGKWREMCRYDYRVTRNFVFTL